MVHERDLSIAAVHRICKKAGADRVSESASSELAQALEKVGVKIAKDAVEYMMHAGRRTLKAKDIKIAAKKVSETPRL
ncbi:MAG: NFYB/HAP3 family transcription factor subunit [Nitrososphaerota archaeon]